MSNQIVPFEFGGEQIRVEVVDGDPWFVAQDVAKILEYSATSAMTRRIDAEDKGVRDLHTLGGMQSFAFISEAGMYAAIFGSQAPGALAFKRVVTHEILPSIRRTGSYSVAAAPVELDRRALALMVIEAEDARVAAEQRAVEGERFRAAIESNTGLSPREFHKAYFANLGERAFFEELYARGLLLDQRGKGSLREDGTVRDGSQHGHPSYAGKQYFYLASGVSRKTGYRFEQTRVRPGQPELALVEYLTKRGFEATRTMSKELAA